MGGGVVNERTDELLRLYWRLEHPGPPALNPVAWTGRVYAPACPHCSSTRRALEACADCGARWPWEDCDLLRWQIDRTPVIRMPDPSLKIRLGYVIYRLALDERWVWETRVYYPYALRVEGCRTIRELAVRAQTELSDAPWPWTATRTWRLVQAGRLELGRRLRREGLIRRSA